MTPRARATAAVEECLLNAALSHAHRAEQIVRAIEDAGLVVVEARSDHELVEQLAADMCDQGRRPARTQYHPSSWAEVSRVDAEGFRRQAAGVLAKVHENAASLDDEWFVVDLAADLCDGCRRPHRKSSSVTAWHKAQQRRVASGDHESDWWVDYARQVIALTRGAS